MAPYLNSVRFLALTRFYRLSSTWLAGKAKSAVPPIDCLLSKPGMRARLVDGNAMADSVCTEVCSEITKMTSSGRRAPNLTVVLVGDDPASHTYVTKKQNTAKRCRMNAQTIRKPSSISQDELMQLINDLNSDPTVDGLLVQLPLPNHINESTICNAVSPEKDVDGFNQINIGKYSSGHSVGFIPATPLGILEILKRCHIATFGQNVCVVGRSKHIGFPLATLLHSDRKYSELCGDATVTMCHRYTPSDQLVVMTRHADIVISATGVTGLIKGDMIKPGAVVIDVGLTKVQLPCGKSKLMGDVDFDSVSQVASLLTPVPGGVGPMTVAMLMKNTLEAAQRRFRLCREHC